MIKELWKALLLLVALGVVTYGLYLIYTPLAYLFGGGYLFAVVAMSGKPKAKAQ